MQSCDLVLISAELCSTKLKTSNISQQKLDSLKGAQGGKADTDSVSSHTQSEAGHNYQDVNADTEMLSVQPSAHLNEKPFTNEQSGEKETEVAREFFLFFFLEQTLKHCFSFLNIENQHVGGIPEKPLQGKRGDSLSLCVTQSVCLHQRGAHK